MNRENIIEVKEAKNHTTTITAIIINYQTIIFSTDSTNLIIAVFALILICFRIIQSQIMHFQSQIISHNKKVDSGKVINKYNSKVLSKYNPKAWFKTEPSKGCCAWSAHSWFRSQSDSCTSGASSLSTPRHTSESYLKTPLLPSKPPILSSL